MSNLVEKMKKYFLIFFSLFVVFLFAILATSNCTSTTSLSDGVFKTEKELIDENFDKKGSDPKEDTQNNIKLTSQQAEQEQERIQESSTDKNARGDEEKVKLQFQEENQSQNKYQTNEPEGIDIEIVEDPEITAKNTDEAAPKTNENAAQSSPCVSLEIILGPEYAQDSNICFWRIKAVVSGNPAPEIKFSKDDSNGSWGESIAQVNLSEGQSYTLVCEVKNSAGSASSSLTLGWVENPAGSESDQMQNQQGDQSTIQIDYQDVANFKIDVNLSTQKVTVYYKESIIKSMICSGGLPQSPTPLGSYTTYQKIYYAWIPKFNQGAYYWTRFYGSYLIHSVPFDKGGNIISEEYAKLGSPASHGCIRLEVEDAKWLYEILPLGISVIIHN